MQTADESTQRLADTWENPYAMDDGNRVRFEMMDVENPEKTKEAGYPIFDTLECVRIKAPGSIDENVIPLRKERQRLHYQARFPRHYAAFKAGLEEPVDGYPLKNWPPMATSRGELELYAFHGVKTIQALAAVSDSHISTLGNNALKRRQQAKDWVATAKSNAPVERLRAENDEIRNQLEVALRAITELQKQAGIAPAAVAEVPPPLEAQTEPDAPKKRGRPRKEANP